MTHATGINNLDIPAVIRHRADRAKALLTGPSTPATSSRGIDMPITIPTQFGPADVDTGDHELAIHDYGTQHEAELAACVFGSLITLQEK